MDELKRIERKKQATLARRHIYTESKKPETFITSLSEEAREAFFASERKRIATNLRKRRIKTGVFTGIGVAIAIFISALALVPIFFVGIMSLINSFKIFREVYLLTGDYPFDNLYMLQHFMNNSFTHLDYSKLSAGAIVMCIVMIIIVGGLFFAESKFDKDVEE